jgi:hypothetical protein
MNHESTEIMTLMTIATMKPSGLLSIPFTRFIPKNEATNVGNMRIIVTDVSVRMMVFMLLLIIDW